MNTYTKDEQVKLDTFTLRQLFDEKEISYEFVAKKFVRRAIMEMEKMLINLRGCLLSWM